MENRYKIDYDIKHKCTSNVRFIQGDIDTSVLEIVLYDGGISVDMAGETLEFRFLKADNTIVFQDMNNGVSIINASQGNFQCILKGNTLSSAGIVRCEIIRKKNGLILTCPAFSFTVENSIGGIFLSSNYIASIENKIIEWQHDEELRQRTFDNNEGVRKSSFNTNESNRQNTFTTNETNRQNVFDTNEAKRKASMLDVENRFSKLTTDQQQSAEVVNARTSGVYNKTFQDLNKRIEETEKEVIPITYGQIIDSQDNIISLTGGYNGIANLDVKGNTMINMFINQNDGWSSIGRVTLDSTIKLYNNSSLKLTSSNSGDWLTREIATDTTHKYYFRCSAYIASYTSGAIAIECTDEGTWNNAVVNNFDTTKLNQWQAQSIIFTGKSSSRVFFGSGGVGTNITYFDGVILIDLTTIYGAGNEPSKEWCDANIPYFSGMQSVDKIEVLSRGKNLIKNGNCENGLNYWNTEPLSAVTIENNKFKIISTGGSTGTNGVFQLIKVKSNTNYHLKWNSITGTTESRGAISLNKSLNLWLRTIGSNDFTFNTGNNTEIYVWVGTSAVGYVYVDSIQLEEGTTATAYEPYKEDKINILTTLRGLSNTKDTINKDGVVNRNCGQTILNGTENWALNTTTQDCIMFRLADSNYSNLTINAISDKFKTNSNLVTGTENIEGIIQFNGYILISILKSRLSTQDVAGFKQWLASNNVTVIYQLETPTTEQIQPLQLSCYSNGNLVVNSNIPPYVSAKYPQNIGADLDSYSTINYGRINDDNLSFPIYKNINDSLDPVFSLDNANTGIADVSVKGNTLVNIATPKTKSSGNCAAIAVGDMIELALNPNIFWLHITELTLNKIKPNTEYTLRVNINSTKPLTKGIRVEIRSFEGAVTLSSRVTITRTGVTTIKLLTNSSFDGLDLSAVGLWFGQEGGALDFVSGDKIQYNIVLLEGDYMQNPPQEYFEGMQSVSNVEVLSQGKNLFDRNLLNNVVAEFGTLVNNQDTISVNKDDKWACQFVLKNNIAKPFFNNLCVGQTISVSNITGINEIKISKDGGSAQSEAALVIKCVNGKGSAIVTREILNNDNIYFTDISGNQTIQVNKDMMFYYGADTNVPYEPYKEDKMKILLSPLRRINNNIYDYINKDGLKTVNIKEIVIDGSQNCGVSRTDTNTVLFYFSNLVTNYKTISNDTINYLSNKLLSYSGSYLYNTDIEGVCINIDSVFQVRYLKSKLGIIDSDTDAQKVQKLKTYLTANNITLDYQVVATTEQIQPLQLSCFDNGSIAVNNAIPPYVSVKYPANKASALESYANIKVGEINEALQKQKNEINGLWKTFLPLADRELRMKSIALLATETTTDLKNKLNEILNVWR